MSTLSDEDQSFVAVLPLPFRVLVLAGLGILAWATNLHGLAAANIDPGPALDLSSPHAHSLSSGQYSPILPASPGPNPRLAFQRTSPTLWYTPVYRLVGAYVLWVGGGYLWF